MFYGILECFRDRVIRKRTLLGVHTMAMHLAESDLQYFALRNRVRKSRQSSQFIVRKRFHLIFF